MALSVREAHDAVLVIEWATGRRVTLAGGCVSDERATDAARRLTERARKALAAGPRPEEVRLSSARVLRELLIQLANQPGDGLDLADQLAIGRVLDVLDRIDRQAATAAGSEES